jgi:hypothetical protein
MKRETAKWVQKAEADWEVGHKLTGESPAHSQPDWQREYCGRPSRRVVSTNAPVGPIRPQAINGRTPIGQPARLDRSTDKRIWLRMCLA